MKVFLDTNAVIDFCARRADYDNVAQIFTMAENGMLEIVVSALTIVNVAYIMRKVSMDEVMPKIALLMNLCIVSSVNKDVIAKAYSSNQKDFEDSIQYFSSQLAGSDVIITNDKTGFAGFDIPVMTPKKFIENCNA